jgi:DNA-binding transcriptional LysR family regulator
MLWSESMPEEVSIPFGDLREIDCFLEVAKTLHFRRAAEALHVPQPHLSRVVRRLEQRLGVELFRRTSRRVELTPAGRVFADEARVFRAAAERATRRAHLAAAGAAGTLVIGSIPGAALHPLPAHVTSFRARYPDVHVALTEQSSASLCHGLETYALDVAYVRPVDAPGLRFHELGRESNCVVVPGEHPWAVRPSVALRDLDAQPFVYFERRDGPDGYDALMSTFAASGIAPRLVTAVPTVVAAIGFVRAGAGFTLLPDTYRSLAPDLAFVVLEDAGPPVRLLVATRAEGAPLVDAYVEHVRDDARATTDATRSLGSGDGRDDQAEARRARGMMR